MELLKILPIDPIPPAKTNLCWAASIEMGLKKYLSNSSSLQNRLCIENSHPHSDICLGQTMPNDDYYYHKYIKNEGFICSQIKSKTFPKTDFFYSLILKEIPVIISGINYPLIYGDKHSIFVRGYYKKYDISWLLTNDPLTEGKKSKVAWIYCELISYHQSINETRFFTTRTHVINSQSLTIDFVSNFQVSDECDSLDFTNNENLRIIAPSITFNQLKDNINNVILTSTSLIAEFFKYTGGQSKVQKPFKYTSIRSEWELDKIMLEIDLNINRHYLCSVFVDNVPFIEVILQQRLENQIYILGVKETSNPSNITLLNFIVSGQLVEYKLSHDEPNYEMIIVTPFNLYFFVFDFQEKKYFVPSENFRDFFQKGMVYSYQKYKQVINSINHQ